MKIAIFGKTFGKSFHKPLQSIFETLKNHKIDTRVYSPYYDFICEEMTYQPQIDCLFNNHSDLGDDTDILLSIGGDGTFLEAVSFVRNSGIPILGINSGNLGFLSYVSKDAIQQALEAIITKDYDYEYRTLIKVETENNLFGEFNYGLNECTIHKKDTSSMIRIHTFMDNEYLNTYWADGLIIATPTGSTAYSLSVGGPIVMPNSSNFVLSPIATHNLTVRPLVIPDSSCLKLIVEGRSPHFLASLDYRSKTFDSSTELIVKKAGFRIRKIKLKNYSFFGTMRTKLMWGIDKRNNK